MDATCGTRWGGGRRANAASWGEATRKGRRGKGGMRISEGGGVGKGERPATAQRLDLARLTRPLHIHTNGETPGLIGVPCRYALVDSDNGDGPVKSLIRRMRAKYALFPGTKSEMRKLEMKDSRLKFWLPYTRVVNDDKYL